MTLAEMLRADLAAADGAERLRAVAENAIATLLYEKPLLAEGFRADLEAAEGVEALRKVAEQAIAALEAIASEAMPSAEDRLESPPPVAASDAPSEELDITIDVDDRGQRDLDVERDGALEEPRVTNARYVWHFAREEENAICGADHENMSTTLVAENTTCPACLPLVAAAVVVCDDHLGWSPFGNHWRCLKCLWSQHNQARKQIDDLQREKDAALEARDEARGSETALVKARNAALDRQRELEEELERARREHVCETHGAAESACAKCAEEREAANASVAHTILGDIAQERDVAVAKRDQLAALVAAGEVRQEEVERLERELEVETEVRKAYEKTVEVLRLQVLDDRRELGAAVASLKADAERLARERDALSKAVDGLKNDGIKERAEAARLQEQLDEAARALGEARARAEGMRGQVAEVAKLRDALAWAEATIERMQSDRRAAEEKLFYLQGELRVAADQTAVAKRRHKAAEDAAGDLEKRLDAARAEALRAGEKMLRAEERAKDAVARLEATLAELETGVVSDGAQLSPGLLRLRELDAALIFLKARVAGAADAFANLDKLIDELPALRRGKWVSSAMRSWANEDANKAAARFEEFRRAVEERGDQAVTEALAAMARLAFEKVSAALGGEM